MAARQNQQNDPTPSLSEILQIVNGKEQDKGITKVLTVGACGMIGSILLALMLWVGVSVSGLSTSVTKIGADVDSLQKSMTALQASQTDTTKTIGSLQVGLAAQGARQDATDADMNRVKERLRIVEGQKPLGQ